MRVEANRESKTWEGGRWTSGGFGNVSAYVNHIGEVDKVCDDFGHTTRECRCVRSNVH
jgi:hypothetical protein